MALSVRPLTNRGSDNPALQATLAPADGLYGVDKHIPTLGLVLVLGDVWASGEL